MVHAHTSAARSPLYRVAAHHSVAALVPAAGDTKPSSAPRSLFETTPSCLQKLHGAAQKHIQYRKQYVYHSVSAAVYALLKCCTRRTHTMSCITSRGETISSNIRVFEILHSIGFLFIFYFFYFFLVLALYFSKTFVVLVCMVCMRYAWL